MQPVLTLQRFTAHILARKAISSPIRTHYANGGFTGNLRTPANRIFTLSCCTESFPVVLCGSPRPGRLPAAVHQDLREGESRGGPAAAYHPPGVGGFGSVQNRPPGAHTGGCGLTLCSGESKLPTLSSHHSVLSLQRVLDHCCWMKFQQHIW